MKNEKKKLVRKQNGNTTKVVLVLCKVAWADLWVVKTQGSAHATLHSTRTTLAFCQNGNMSMNWDFFLSLSWLLEQLSTKNRQTWKSIFLRSKNFNKSKCCRYSSTFLNVIKIIKTFLRLSRPGSFWSLTVFSGMIIIRFIKTTKRKLRKTYEIMGWVTGLQSICLSTALNGFSWYTARWGG